MKLAVYLGAAKGLKKEKILKALAAGSPSVLVEDREPNLIESDAAVIFGGPAGIRDVKLISKKSPRSVVFRQTVIDSGVPTLVVNGGMLCPYGKNPQNFMRSWCWKQKIFQIGWWDGIWCDYPRWAIKVSRGSGRKIRQTF